jgi:hypothetical protein
VRTKTIKNLHRCLKVSAEGQLEWESETDFASIEANSRFMDDDYVQAHMIKADYDTKRKASMVVQDTEISLTVYMQEGVYKTFIKIGKKPTKKKTVAEKRSQDEKGKKVDEAEKEPEEKRRVVILDDIEKYRSL